MDEIFLPSIHNGEDKSSPFVNCLRNNYRHIRKWAKRTNTDAFRIYDREVPHYPVAIDFYAGHYCVHYFSSTREVEEAPQELVDDVEKALKLLFNASDESIYWRTRAKNKQTRQYERLSTREEFFIAHEYGVEFKVNLTDYLDTGLFLDHRETRQIVAAHAKGKRLLNLFAYTCSFTVHAALKGAIASKSVDMSNTYTAWGRDNLALNGIDGEKHEVVRADCLKFLNEEIAAGGQYELIVIDPPTLSRSKKMEQLFDVQEDYIVLLSKALKLLAPSGVLFFSTNARKFAFDPSYFEGYRCVEISDKTIPIDFRGSRIHRCWKIFV